MLFKLDFGSFRVFTFKILSVGEVEGGVCPSLFYGRPSQEAVEVDGQTLSRVQKIGLKIGNKI